MVGRARALAVEIVNRTEPVKDQTARGNTPVRRHGKDLVDPSLELAATDQLGQKTAQRPIEVDRRPRKPLPGGDGNRQGICCDVSRGGADERDPHC